MKKQAYDVSVHRARSDGTCRQERTVQLSEERARGVTTLADGAAFAKDSLVIDMEKAKPEM